MKCACVASENSVAPATNIIAYGPAFSCTMREMPLRCVAE